jgi:hypothetical protein
LLALVAVVAVVFLALVQQRQVVVLVELAALETQEPQILVVAEAEATLEVIHQMVVVQE